MEMVETTKVAAKLRELLTKNNSKRDLDGVAACARYITIDHLGKHYKEYTDNQVDAISSLYATRFLEKTMIKRGNARPIDILSDIDLFIAGLEANSATTISPDFNINLAKIPLYKSDEYYRVFKRAFKFTKEFISSRHIPLFIIWLQDSRDELIIHLPREIKKHFQLCKFNFFRHTVVAKIPTKYTIEKDNIKTLNFLLQLCAHDTNLIQLMTLIGAENVVKMLTFMTDSDIHIPSRNALNLIYDKANKTRLDKDRLDELFMLTKDTRIPDVRYIKKKKRYDVPAAMIIPFFRSVFDKLDTAQDKLLAIIEKQVAQGGVDSKMMVKLLIEIQKENELQMKFFTNTFGDQYKNKKN